MLEQCANTDDVEDIADASTIEVSGGHLSSVKRQHGSKVSGGTLDSSVSGVSLLESSLFNEDFEDCFMSWYNFIDGSDAARDVHLQTLSSAIAIADNDLGLHKPLNTSICGQQCGTSTSRFFPLSDQHVHTLVRAVDGGVGPSSPILHNAMLKTAVGVVVRPFGTPPRKTRQQTKVELPSQNKAVPALATPPLASMSA